MHRVKKMQNGMFGLDDEPEPIIHASAWLPCTMGRPAARHCFVRPPDNVHSPKDTLGQAKIFD